MSYERNAALVALIPDSFGEYVYEERMRIGMSQSDLARFAGVNGSTISYIESGARAAGMRTATAILKGLLLAEKKLAIINLEKNIAGGVDTL